MTGNLIPLDLYLMGKRSSKGQKGTPGRKVGKIPPARSDFQLEFARRVREGREKLGRMRGREITQNEMARLLTLAAGYEVPADNYRKYEGGKGAIPRKPSMMPHDLIFHFAELTEQTTGRLLAPVSFPTAKVA